MLFLAAVSCRADTPDPVDIIRQSIKVHAGNRIKAATYTFQEYHVARYFDSHGGENRKDRETETWDVVALEGSAYRKLILRNDKPLVAKEQKKEDERLLKEAELRKKETAEQRRSRLFEVKYSYIIPYPKIPDIYDLKFLRSEEIAGREAYVIECTPKTSFTPATADEKESLNFRTVLWIDRQDMFPVSTDLEVIGDHSRLRRGSRATLTESKINEDVWMPKETKVNFAVSVFKLITIRAEKVVTFSGFKKFQVSSSITPTPDEK